jgi:hypothetical protein
MRQPGAKYNIPIGFGIPWTIVRLIKIRLIDTYSKILTSKSLPDAFPIQNGLKHGDALSAFLLE